MARQCGNCSMCCKVLHIADLDKPAGVWCEHIGPGCSGCGIYETRFEICRSYRCNWLMDESLGPEWQPNRCKFIMHRVDGKVGLWVNVDRAYPLAWRKEPFYAQIKAWSAAARDGSGYVAVCGGNTTWVVFPEEDLVVADLPSDADLKVGYRRAGDRKRPLVMIRDRAGSIRECLGEPVPA